MRFLPFCDWQPSRDWFLPPIALCGFRKPQELPIKLPRQPQPSKIHSDDEEKEQAETDSSPLTGCQGKNTRSRVSKEVEASGQRNIPYLPVQSIPGLVFLQPSHRWLRRQARTQLPTPLGGMVGISSTASQNGRCCRSWPQPLLLKSTG